MEGFAGAGFTGTRKYLICTGVPSLSGGALIYRQKTARLRTTGWASESTASREAREYCCSHASCGSTESGDAQKTDRSAGGRDAVPGNPGEHSFRQRAGVRSEGSAAVAGEARHRDTVHRARHYPVPDSPQCVGVSSGSTSLMAQDRHRIHIGRTSSGHIARQQSDAQE